MIIRISYTDVLAAKDAEVNRFSAVFAQLTDTSHLGTVVV